MTEVIVPVPGTGKPIGAPNLVQRCKRAAQGCSTAADLLKRVRYWMPRARIRRKGHLWIAKSGRARHDVGAPARIEVHVELHGRDGSPDQKSLDGIALLGAQKRQLLVGLDPLRDHDHAEGVGQLDRGAHDRVGIPVAAEACHEGPVDLDLVDRKPPELS